MEKTIGERDIVLFLGAGFSRDGACLPLMCEFGSFSESAFSGIKRHYEAKDKEAASILYEAGEIFKEFQKFCCNYITLREKEVNNLETVFCIAEALIESNQKENRINGHKIDDVIKNIPLWLWKIYQQFPPLNKNYPLKNEISQEVYFDFFEIIRRNSKRLVVITTNYDLVFEHYSREKNLRCVYPLRSYEEISVTSSQEKFVLVDETKNKNEIVLCKLHGSVNYFNEGDDNKLKIVNDVGDITRIGKSGSWENKIALFALDSIWQLRQKYGKGLIPAIVPPTYAKLTKKDWLRDIWDRTFNALVQAKKIIFVGYSFPESDGFMRALFHGAMSFRQDSPEVFVIDPCDRVHERYKSFFKDAYKEIKPKKQKLKTAIRRALPKLLNAD